VGRLVFHRSFAIMSLRTGKQYLSGLFLLKSTPPSFTCLTNEIKAFLNSIQNKRWHHQSLNSKKAVRLVFSFRLFIWIFFTHIKHLHVHAFIASFFFFSFSPKSLIEYEKGNTTQQGTFQKFIDNEEKCVVIDSAKKETG